MTNARKRYNAAVESIERIKAAIYAHEKTYCRETMDERSHFAFVQENGGRHCMSANNPKYDPDAALAYSRRLSELRNELEKCKDEENRAFWKMQIVEILLSPIIFVRWCFKRVFGVFKRIEEETRPE